MRPDRFVVKGIVAALLQATVGAQAMASPADDAEPLVQEGIAFRSSFHDAEALEKFQRAYAIAKTPRIQAQIGAAEQALGRWVDAEVHVAGALEASSDSWIVKNRPTLESARNSIRSHLGSLEILGKPAGAEIRIEGEIVGRLPLVTSLRLPVGRTTLEVRAPGHFVVTRSVSIEPGKLTRETVVLRAEESARAGAVAGVGDGASGVAAGASTEVTSTPTSPFQGQVGIAAHPPAGDTTGGAGAAIGWRRPTEIAAAGLAAVGLAFGIVEHLRWQDKVDSFESMNGCGAALPDHGGAGCDKIYTDGQSARTLAFVGYGAAAALGATAAILFFTDGERGAQKVACAPALRARGVECAWRF